jgi:hypothetical protein
MNMKSVTKKVLSSMRLIDVFDAALNVAQHEYMANDTLISNRSIWTENRAAEIVRDMMEDIK